MNFLKVFDGADRYERLKILYLSGAFFFVIAAYSVMRELKDSVFIYVVGRSYLPTAKILSMVVLIPAILLFSYLVDRMRRYKLLCAYSIAFSLIGLVCAYLLGNSVIGLDNTAASPNRLFGWFFFFFIEGYSPFIVSLFWAFANSVSSPKETKQYYPLMVAGSKVGGMFTAALAWYFFSCHYNLTSPMSSTAKHQVIVVISSLLLMLVPLVIYSMIKTVPGYRLHGYEAVYKEEKAMKKAGVEKTGIFAGLWLLFRVPYVMGIFGMIFFYEVLNVVLSYQRLIIADQAAKDVGGLSCSLFEQVFFVHFFTVLISLFGTTYLLRKYGERKCLLFIPIATGLLIAIFMIFGTWHWHVLTTVFVLMRAINYAVSYPVRESLYVPTMKEIKFKSKSWIDSFGQKFAKSFGSTFNKAAESIYLTYGASVFVSIEAAFFGVLVGCWILVAYLLGRRYSQVVEKNETIGLES
ncbi:MAG TPA: Npt1/Npt2 family nucleotide transporter [Candidatus Babeliales bacterium]|nr:Npt1/Npt2 family nucleotide transporter [Candidatus Babeliales bacterium]